MQDVNIKSFDLKSKISPLKSVIYHSATYGVGKSSLIISRANGKNIVALAAIFQSSPLVFVTKK